MNLCMAILTKSYKAFQTLKFMSDNGNATNLIGFIVHFQIICLTAHLTAVTVTDSNLALYLFPIRVILQTLPVLRWFPLLVCQSRHFHPPFSTGFLQMVRGAIRAAGQK